MGELFAGYGGLGMGVAEVLDVELVWYSEIDKGALKVLEHRFPDVPNIGDITTVDWSQVEPVDVLTGGFPCQDVSAAGKRAGIRPGTRSGLWSQFAYAIDQLRPRLVVIENVRGLLSADAHSDVEPCPWCVGDEPDGALRALGAVLGDLADLGFDADWLGLPASSVGAPHGRWREFIVAYPATHPGRVAGEVPAGWGLAAIEEPASNGDPGRARLLPSPRATDGTKGGPNQRGSSGDLMLPSAVQQLLPTPTTTQRGADSERDSRPGAGPNLHNAVTLLPTPEASRNGNTPENHHRRKPGRTVVTNLEVLASGGLLPTPRSSDPSGEFSRSSEGFRPQLGEVARLLPTLSAGAPDAKVSDRAREVYGSTDRIADVVEKSAWGQYAAAIARWEAIHGPAPAPTETGPKGNPRLSAAFSEWMMGLLAGWVTDVPGITRNEALKALGNGVVPQQAAAALRLLLSSEVAA